MSVTKGDVISTGGQEKNKGGRPNLILCYDRLCGQSDQLAIEILAWPK